MKHRKPHNPQWAHQIETMLAEWAVPLALAIATLLIITIIIPTGIDIYQSWGNIEAKERAKTGIELIQLVATIVGGIAIFWNIIIARRQLVATQEQNITDRFSKAVEQLGHDETAVRVGGVYALERISQDSLRDHGIIMEVLTAFVRDQRILGADPELANTPIRFDRDIQSAIIVMGRRDIDANSGPLYLNHADLRKLSFFDGDYQNTRFHYSDLREANFFQSNLQNARFWRANLAQAKFVKSDLSSADFVEADLREVNFRGCVLQGANLQDANLSGAIDLTVEQVKSAKNWQQAIYSPELAAYLGLPPREPHA